MAQQILNLHTLEVCQFLTEYQLSTDIRINDVIIQLPFFQTDTIVGMLMSASEQISTGLNSRKPGGTCADDADTLLRVLCHKKDEEASKFLKMHYQLPKSSGVQQCFLPTLIWFNITSVVSTCTDFVMMAWICHGYTIIHSM